jgi:hypothetical protein
MRRRCQHPEDQAAVISMLPRRCLLSAGSDMLHRVGRSALNTCWPALTQQHVPKRMIDGERDRVVPKTSLTLYTAHQSHENATAPVRSAVSDRRTGCSRAHVSALRRPLPQDLQLMVNVQAAAAHFC